MKPWGGMMSFCAHTVSQSCDSHHKTYRASVLHHTRKTVCEIDPWTDEHCTRWLFEAHVAKNCESGKAKTASSRVPSHYDLRWRDRCM